MTVPDYTDNWRRYWERVHESNRRLEVEHAAADPLGRWLTAEAPVLVEKHDVDPDHLREDPDGVLADARTGFEDYVEAAGLGGVDDDRYGYEVLPVHLSGVGRVPGTDFDLEDPVADANAVCEVTNARITAGPRTECRPAVVTYRCPVGHETTVRTTPLRQFGLDACGNVDCSNPVVPEDRRTRVRRVVEFTVESGGTRLPCVGTGRYAAEGRDAVAADASTLSLTGIVRLLARSDGTVEPTVEVLHAEPT